MPVRHSFILLLSFTLAVGSGCRPAGDDDAVPDEEQPPPRLDLAEERVDTLHLEGAPHVVSLALFDDPDVPIATYYPEEDFDVEVISSARASSLHFVATFGGTRNEDASFRLFFPDPGSALNRAGALQELVEERGGIGEIEGFATEQTHGHAACPDIEFTWSLRADDGRSGFMCIDSERDQWYLILALYPQEYGEGFEPRVALILENMHWKPD